MFFFFFFDLLKHAALVKGARQLVVQLALETTVSLLL